MAFETLNVEEKHGFLIALHAALLDDDVSRGSFVWLWLMTAAAASSDNDAHLEAVKNDLLPDTAPDDGMLDRHGTMKGVARKGATPARGDNALRVFGTALTVVPALAKLTHTSGLKFMIEHAGVIGADGFDDVDVVALSTGSATRLGKGEHLTFDAAPAGLSGDAELQIDLTEDGVDIETEGSFRERILSRWKDPPLGGTAEDYVQWAKAVTGWETAYCYPLRRGWGSVDLAALHAGSGTVRAPIAPEVADLQAIIDLKRPVSTKPFRVLFVTTQAVNVDVQITGDGAPSHAFDWDDAVPPHAVAWDGATRTMDFDVRPEIAPGDRIILANTVIGAADSGRERVVESLGPGAAQVVLEVDDQGDIPDIVGGCTVYSGGDLVQPARTAIRVQLFDALGTANPDATYGTWEGDVDPDAIGDCARSVAGVRRATVTAPAALVEAADPAYPDDDSVELLVTGRLIVRAKH